MDASRALQFSAVIDLSIVIPTLNEAQNLPDTLATIWSGQETTAIEIIVVDGGSQDTSLDIAARSQAQVLKVKPGRANQMNAGAAIAQGRVLLFLHADTQLPDQYLPLIHQALIDSNTVAGAFRLKIDGSTWGLRGIEWGVNLRSCLFQLPYGDQALFLPRKTFDEIGGFPDLPIMEDFVLVQRLKRQGKIAIVPASVITSSRRWQKLGIVKTTLINQLMLIGYGLGISPHKLADWYRNLR